MHALVRTFFVNLLMITDQCFNCFWLKCRKFLLILRYFWSRMALLRPSTPARHAWRSHLRHKGHLFKFIIHMTIVWLLRKLSSLRRQDTYKSSEEDSQQARHQLFRTFEWQAPISTNKQKPIRKLFATCCGDFTRMQYDSTSTPVPDYMMCTVSFALLPH